MIEANLAGDALAFANGAAPISQSLPAKRSGPASGYSEEIADKICDRMTEGESLRAICRDPEMPNKATVLRWIAKHPDFERQYRLAREAKIDGMADEIIEIADDKSDDWVLAPAGKEGSGESGAVPLLLNKTAIARSRLMIETRKWCMAKEMPRKYGDLVLPPPAGPPANGDEAKLVNGTVIENDPLHNAMNAWSKAKR